MLSVLLVVPAKERNYSELCSVTAVGGSEKDRNRQRTDGLQHRTRMPLK